MRHIHFRLTISTLLALTLATCIFAHGQFWEFLGYTRVDRSRDHGRIEMRRHDLSYRTIQLRVSGEAIFFDRVVVHFVDGTSREVVVSSRVSPSGSNYIIDLLRERALESVELWYYKEPWDQNPTVTAYGVRLSESDTEAIARKP